MGDDSFLAAMDKAAESLDHPGPVESTNQRVVEAAVAVVPGADHASLTLLHKRDGRLETSASTGELALRLDALQYELHEGPCYEAAIQGDVRFSSAVKSDPRWPRFGPRADELGICSQLAMTLREDDKSRVGLNLYSTTEGALAGSELTEAHVVSGYARIALGFATELDGLTAALTSRTTIGTAIGIVMERYGLDRDRAFRFLTRLSQTSNVKLRDIALGVVDVVDSAAVRQPQ